MCYLSIHVTLLYCSVVFLVLLQCPLCCLELIIGYGLIPLIKRPSSPLIYNPGIMLVGAVIKSVKGAVVEVMTSCT